MLDYEECKRILEEVYGYDLEDMKEKKINSFVFRKIAKYKYSDNIIKKLLFVITYSYEDDRIQIKMTMEQFESGIMPTFDVNEWAVIGMMIEFLKERKSADV